MKTTNWKRAKTFINSFLPRFIFKISLRRLANRNHWKKQKFGDPHGYDKYTQDHPRAPYLLAEVASRVRKTDSILDLGCNCGYYLKTLKHAGFTQLAGVDISKDAIEYGQNEFGLQEVEFHIASFEEALPKLVRQNRQFNLIFSMGATIELVHPSFDIIKHLTLLSSQYVILFISEWAHATPRYYEFEFQQHGFLMVKCIRPFDGSLVQNSDIAPIISLLVFQKLPL